MWKLTILQPLMNEEIQALSMDDAWNHKKEKQLDNIRFLLKKFYHHLAKGIKSGSDQLSDSSYQC